MKIVLILVVLGMARADEKLQTFVARIGETIDLLCKRKPGDNVVWEKVSKIGSSAISINGQIQKKFKEKYSVLLLPTGEQNLVIINVDIDDNAIIRCYSFPYVAKDDFFAFNVTVIGPPTSVIFEAPTTAVDFGQLVKLVCKSLNSRPAPKITWNYQNLNGTVIELSSTFTDKVSFSGAVDRTSILKVNLSRDMYNSEFRCLLDIPEISYWNLRSTKLKINMPPGPPKIFTKPSPVVINQRVEVVCRTEGATPTASIQLTVSSRPGSSPFVKKELAADGTYNTVGTISFTAIHTDHLSMITCNATNDVGPIKTYSAIEHLQIDYPPIVNFFNGPIIRTPEHETVTLSCQYDANPVPTHMIWLFGDEQIEKLELAGENSVSNMTLYNLTREQGGLYSCKVINTVGTSTAYVDLDILYSPECIEDLIPVHGVNLGDSIQLRCNLRAPTTTDVIVHWHQNTSLIERSEATLSSGDTQTHTSVLNYTITAPADFVKIKCVGENGIGLDSAAAMCIFDIREASPAELPERCYLLNMTSYDARLTCVPGYSGGSRVWYSLQLLRDVDGELMFVTQANTTVNGKLELVVEHLQPGLTYVIRICVVNDEFWMNQSCSGAFEITTFSENDMINEAFAKGLPALKMVSLQEIRQRSNGRFKSAEQELIDNYAQTVGWLYMGTYFAIGLVILIVLVFGIFFTIYCKRQQAVNYNVDDIYLKQCTDPPPKPRISRNRGAAVKNQQGKDASETTDPQNSVWILPSERRPSVLATVDSRDKNILTPTRTLDEILAEMNDGKLERKKVHTEYPLNPFYSSENGDGRMSTALGGSIPADNDDSLSDKVLNSVARGGYSSSSLSDKI